MSYLNKIKLGEEFLVKEIIANEDWRSILEKKFESYCQIIRPKGKLQFTQKCFVNNVEKKHILCEKICNER